MEKEATKPIGADTGGNRRFLLCDIAGGITDSPSLEEEWVASPIQCLDKAVDWEPEIIVISFGQISIREREALVELSAALKRNSHTRKCIVLALLHSMHRRLIEDLEKAKADYVRCVGDVRLDSRFVQEIIEALGPGDRLQWHLERLCPFVHYRQVDSQHEMTVCGAYLDRMVLGGRRLNELCQTEAHRHCEYYSNQRFKR